MEVKIKDLTVNEFEKLIHKTVEESMEEIIEDIIASSNPKYIDSISEARKDYKSGKTKNIKSLL